MTGKKNLKFQQSLTKQIKHNRFGHQSNFVTSNMDITHHQQIVR